ncbi:TIGR00266 family protein [Candidatus Dojkabacteria bacterium]|nr:TIGR00266 family protein [Candidatus Dojkabacteria bacterium]
MKKAEKIEKIKSSEIIDEKEKGTVGISYDTIGTTLQALNVQLDEGESIYSETGKMSWMTQNVDMKTRGRGLSKMVSRVITGETLFINEFTSKQGTGVVTFSTDQAGKVIPLDLDQNRSEIIFQRGAFLCAENTVDLKIAFTKRISAGLFGGIGFILQKVGLKSGGKSGKAHLIADGEVVMYNLKKGQQLLVDQGNLLGYEASVDFDIQTVGGGLFNWIFGGEGIFLGVLRGPGKVWLQTRKRTIASSVSGSAQQYAPQRNTGGNTIGCIIGLIMTLCFMMIIVLGVIADLSA